MDFADAAAFCTRRVTVDFFAATDFFRLVAFLPFAFGAGLAFALPRFIAAIFFAGAFFFAAPRADMDGFFRGADFFAPPDFRFFAAAADFAMNKPPLECDGVITE
jgi:hypothetical protein